MSSTKNLTPLVISTSHVQAAGSEYVWNKLQSPEHFIDGIVTPDVDIKNSEDISRLVSGIPTPFARPAMFKYAMEYIGQAGEHVTPLVTFFKSLQDEWKGLVACLALDNQPITVEKVELVYSDGRSFADTSNLYEPKGALGNMLLKDTELWCDQVAHTNATRKSTPFIYIIRYNGQVVGGTSPESLLFTAPNYDIGAKRGFFSEVTHKFTDPLKGSPSREEVEKLFVYVRHIADAMDTYREQFSKAKPQVRKLERFLESWLEEIADYDRRKSLGINRHAIVPNLNKFAAPFDKVFNFQTTLYGWGGRISADAASLNVPSGSEPVEVELSELLLDPTTCTVAEVMLDDPDDATRLGIHLLRADTERGQRFFSLPLSEKGLTIFQDEIEGLLQAGGEIKSRLTGVYDLAEKTLRVTLQVDVSGTTTSFETLYKQPALVEGQHVICWPDFVSPIWDKYYLYSELPHNGADLKAFPLRADRRDFRLLTDGSGTDMRFSRLAVNGRQVRETDTGRLIVEYNMNKIGSMEIKYEIYESAEPFKGIELQVKNKSAGYILFRSLTSGHPHALKDYRNKNINLTGVRTGFDFGSNNICISYAKSTQQPELITFRNRRRCLLGVDTMSNERAAAAPHEVFFFQNEETPSNHIKSMIMVHDDRRVVGYDIDPVIALGEVVKGGLPVFETNIPVENSIDNQYEVRFANQPSYIRYDMKWSNDARENAYKEGLLKALWLKTYAELLEQQKFPASLVWAYPSAMGTDRQQHYRNLWNEVGKLNPLATSRGDTAYPDATVATLPDTRLSEGTRRSAITSDEPKAQTEAFSVCKHALQQQMQVDRKSLVMGFDVGGSTTDIMCLAEKRDRTAAFETFATTLIKEGSIRLAAGRLADATKQSPKFQQMLRSFCRRRNYFINGITVPPDRLNANTAAYYYNVIVDRLRTPGELAEFYRNLAAECPELFTLNAFMTGLIMFYAGQLAHRIRRTQEAHPEDYQEPFSEVAIGCFGKGGRMFDWLSAMSKEASSNYYQDCFYAGYGPQAERQLSRFDMRSPDPTFVKAEVSFGLAGTHEVRATSDKIAELVGEEGFSYNGEPVDEIDAVDGRYLQHFGSQFAAPTEFRRFREFAEIFRQFSKEYFAFNVPSLDEDIRGMRLKAYISNLPEYRAATASLRTARVGPEQPQPEFDFVAPIIILEGMCFLDTVLSPRLFGQA